MQCECKGEFFTPKLPQSPAEVSRFIYWVCTACTRMLKSPTARAAEQAYRAWGVPNSADEGARYSLELGIQLPIEVQRRQTIHVRRAGEL